MNSTESFDFDSTAGALFFLPSFTGVFHAGKMWLVATSCIILLHFAGPPCSPLCIDLVYWFFFLNAHPTVLLMFNILPFRALSSTTVIKLVPRCSNRYGSDNHNFKCLDRPSIVRDVNQSGWIGQDAFYRMRELRSLLMHLNSLSSETSSLHARASMLYLHGPSIIPRSV